MNERMNVSSGAGAIRESLDILLNKTLMMKCLSQVTR